MGMDKLYGIIKKLGDLMKDPEIKVLVYNLQQCLTVLNNQLLELAAHDVNVSFTWERDSQTNAVRILLKSCIETVDYLEDKQ